MSRKSVLATVGSIILALSLQNLATAQTARSGIVGHVSDSAGAVVQHARVELQPGGIIVTSGDTGDFTISGLVAGDYTLSISYVGFSVFSSRVRVSSGE